MVVVSDLRARGWPIYLPNTVMASARRFGGSLTAFTGFHALASEDFFWLLIVRSNEAASEESISRPTDYAPRANLDRKRYVL